MENAIRKGPEETIKCAEATDSKRRRRENRFFCFAPREEEKKIESRAQLHLVICKKTLVDQRPSPTEAQRGVAPVSFLTSGSLPKK